MTAEPKHLSVSMDDSTSVTAVLYQADKKTRAGVTVILGHGAGAGQLHPFMRLFAEGLAERGMDALTFNFQYMEQGRHVPDPKAKLEACYCAVIEAARQHKKLKGNRIVIGGKSMGGRIASQVAAGLQTGELTTPSDSKINGTTKTASGSIKKTSSREMARLRSKRAITAEPPGQSIHIAGLVFLGYPLHPPGRPDKLRDAHLPQIKSPMLFIQGARDAFGSGEEIRATIKKHNLPATLHIVEGGDHSLKVPKSLGVTQTDVYTSILDSIGSWVQNQH